MINFEKDYKYTASLNNKLVYATCIGVYTDNDCEPVAYFMVNDDPDLIYWGKIKRCKLFGGGMQETIINDELRVFSGD